MNKYIKNLAQIFMSNFTHFDLNKVIGYNFSYKILCVLNYVLLVLYVLLLLVFHLTTD